MNTLVRTVILFAAQILEQRISEWGIAYASTL
jgi:hypothetical protein